MSRLSGWCSQLGQPNHAGCRVPLECACWCHGDTTNAQAATQIERMFAVRLGHKAAPNQRELTGAYCPTDGHRTQAVYGPPGLDVPGEASA